MRTVAVPSLSKRVTECVSVWVYVWLVYISTGWKIVHVIV